MARVPRRLRVKAGYSVHKVWRGHNREWNIATPDEKLAYLKFLNDDLESDKQSAGSVLEALTLMSGHVHEVYGISNQIGFSNHMRRTHSRYGMYFNRKHNRCGKVAQGRPHTTLLGDYFHQMLAVFYVHANPVRAKMVKNANDYAWSTHKLYAFGRRSPWMRNVKLPEWYLRLGTTPELRQSAYRRLFEKFLRDCDPGIRKSMWGHYFGPEKWVKQQEKAVEKHLKESS